MARGSTVPADREDGWWRRWTARLTGRRNEPVRRVTGHGLLDGERLYPWEVIERVEETPNTFLIHTTHGVVRLEPKDPSSRRLARRVQEGLAVEAGEADHVSASRIEAWLELRPGQDLVVGPDKRSRWMAVLWGACMVVPLLFTFGVDSSVLTYLFPLFLALGIVLPLVGHLVEGDRAIVDARGLQWSQNSTADWADVTAISRDGVGWRVSTDSDAGGVYLAGPNAERVAAAIEQLLAARRTGAVLPRMGVVPETALSRTGAEDVAAERGLSRPE